MDEIIFLLRVLFCMLIIYGLKYVASALFIIMTGREDSSYTCLKKHLKHFRCMAKGCNEYDLWDYIEAYASVEKSKVNKED